MQLDLMGRGGMRNVLVEKKSGLSPNLARIVRGRGDLVIMSGIGCSRLQLPFTKFSLLTSPWTGTGEEQAWGMRHNPQMVMSLQSYLVMILRWSMTQIASTFPAGSPLI